MIGVIDASALIRLFIPDGPLPDGLDTFFRDVERARNSAIAPDLLIVEAANVLNRKRKLGELTENECVEILLDILAIPIRLFQHRPTLLPAFDLAREYNLSVYDSIYLALAEEHGAIIFSSDKDILKAAESLGLR